MLLTNILFGLHMNADVSQFVVSLLSAASFAVSSTLGVYGIFCLLFEHGRLRWCTKKSLSAYGKLLLAGAIVTKQHFQL